MQTRTVAAALAIAVLALADQAVTGQSQTSPAAVLVTSGSSFRLQAWRMGAGGLEAVWEAGPRSVDANWATRRAEAVMTGRDAPLVVADLDGDSLDDVIVADAFGLTVYGKVPRYFPFAVASESAPPAIAAGDVDGDGAAELILQRRVPGPPVGREIDVLTAEGDTLKSLGKIQLSGSGTAVAVGDVDNDRKADLVSAGATISVLKGQNGSAWVATAELSTVNASVSLVRIGDVDGDGRNEIVAGGTGGKVTVYQHRKLADRVDYPVLWQSPYLMTDGLRASNSGAGPMAVTQAFAIGDVTGNGRPDIVVGVFEMGRIDEREAGARLHVFSFDGRRDFVATWESDVLQTRTIGSVAIGDVDGDGANEFVVNGTDVYRRDEAARSFASVPTGCAACSDGVVGRFAALGEPAAATRVIPLYWDLQGRQLPEEEKADVSLSLFNPWAEARDVTVTVTSANPRIEVANGVIRVPSIAAGATAALPPFSLTARSGRDPGSLMVEIATSAGYRQSVPARVAVTAPLPTYLPDAGARLSEKMALARKENRRVLIMWADSADRASRDLVLGTTRGEVARTLLYEYEVVRAERAENRVLAAKYNVPGAKGRLPYFTILDAEGAVLASRPAKPFKAAGEGLAAWDTKKLNEFLLSFKPDYVDATPLFAAALKQAKREDKTLFLWFNAPW
ncbi:MAG: FG-GAP-like repeat-containing protein [Acidobacteriota bacterium]